MTKSASETIKIGPLQCKSISLVYQLSSQVNWTAEKIMRCICFRVTRCSISWDKAPALNRTMWQLTHHSQVFLILLQIILWVMKPKQEAKLLALKTHELFTQWCFLFNKSPVITQRWLAPRLMKKPELAYYIWNKAIRHWICLSQYQYLLLTKAYFSILHLSHVIDTKVLFKSQCVTRNCGGRRPSSD